MSADGRAGDDRAGENGFDALWRETAGRLADADAIYVEPGGRTWTFAEIEAAVAARAHEIESGGGLPAGGGGMGTTGDGVRLAPSAAGNTVAFIAEFLAARRTGRTFVAIDRTMPQGEREDLLARLADGGVPPETAVIKVTSGSTGKAKGVALTEAALLAGVRNILSTMEIRPDDVNLAAIALSHSYGFDNLVLPLVVQGTPMALLEAFTPRAALDAIAKRRVTFVPLVPVMYEALSGLDGDWSSVRRCISAGSPLDPALVRRFRERTGRKIHTFYGASECGGIAFDRTDDPAPPRGSVGTPLDGVAIDFADDGRVRVRSASVALGPLPPGAAEPWEPGASVSAPGRVGAYVTGDLGEIDGDGRIVLTGRAKDVINVAGRKVAPAEIEACLLGLRGVAEAVVLGVPDPVRGEAIGALVVAARGSDADERALLAHCRESLPAWKVPRVVRVVPALPRDGRGKLARKEIRALLEQDR
jgi:long-chain acyl-CoA synthetase